MSEKDRLIFIIDNYKFDVTEYASKHPGGRAILEKYNKKDATKLFNEIKIAKYIIDKSLGKKASLI